MLLSTFVVMIFAFTMFFGGGMIPTFLLVQKLGLYDSIWAMIIPGAMQIYNMIIMRTYFQSIPGELMEAARIDGTNEWQTLWQIVLPLSKASIATIGLFYAVAHWNSWFNASIYLSSADKVPLQLVLRNMIFNAQALVRSGEADNIGTTTINYATLFISMVPMRDGISPEWLEELRQQLDSHSSDSQTTGLTNVHRRLKLYYGEYGGVELDASSLGGLKVVLKLGVIDT